MGVHYFTLRLKTPRTRSKSDNLTEKLSYPGFTYTFNPLFHSDFGWGSPEVRLPSTGHHHPAADFLECHRVLL